MNIIHYDELTYPEIAALPRKLPLVIPLGRLPGANTLARALRRELGHSPEQVALLPPLPQEWRVPRPRCGGSCPLCAPRSRRKVSARS